MGINSRTTETNKNSENFVINIPTENSFQSLVDTDIRDLSQIFEKTRLNRSCPESGIDAVHDISVMKQTIVDLQAKLESRDKLINIYLEENTSLKKAISAVKLKIDHLMKICQSPASRSTIKKNKIHEAIQTPKAIDPVGTPLALNTPQEAYHSPLSNSTFISNVESKLTKSDTTSEHQESLDDGSGAGGWFEHDTSAARRTNIAKHRVLLLADGTGREVRNVLDKYLGPDFTVVSMLKPNGTLEQV